MGEGSELDWGSLQEVFKRREAGKENNYETKLSSMPTAGIQVDKDIAALSQSILDEFDNIRSDRYWTESTLESTTSEAMPVYTISSAPHDSLGSMTSSEALISDNGSDNAIKGTIDQMPHSPVTPTSADFQGPDGRSLRVEVAVSAYLRDEHTSGNLRKECLPSSPSMPFTALPEKLDELESLDYNNETTLSTRDSLESVANASLPAERPDFEYVRPESWYDSQSSLATQDAGAQDINSIFSEKTASMNASTPEITPPNSPLSANKQKPLPPLPFNVFMTRMERCSRPPPLQLAAVDEPARCLSNLSIRTFDLPSTGSGHALTLEEALRSPSRQYTPSLNEEDLTETHIHPAFRKSTQPKPWRFPSSDMLGPLPPSPLVSPYRHWRKWSDLSNAFSVAPVSRYPSASNSDPIPDRTGEYSPLNLAHPFSRGSLQTSGPGSPLIRNNYYVERRPSPERMRAYARAVEQVHGLCRLPKDPKGVLMQNSTQELLNDARHSMARYVKKDKKLGEERTFPMKRKTSVLRRMIEPANHNREAARNSNDSETSNHIGYETVTARSSSIYSTDTEDESVKEGAKVKAVSGAAVDKQHKDMVKQLLGGVSMSGMLKRRTRGFKQVGLFHCCSSRSDD